MGTPPDTMYRFALLVASAAAVPVQLEQNRYGPAPVPYGPSPAYTPNRAYKPKPVYPVEEEEEEFAPQPYKYEYGVQDDYSKAAFAKSETQNEVGAVTGSYKVNLPDGRIQTVSYTADPVNGYKAVVSYEGEPVYLLLKLHSLRILDLGICQNLANLSFPANFLLTLRELSISWEKHKDDFD